MRLVTTEEMRELDKQAIEGRGVPGLALMERAGYGVAHFTANLLEHDQDKRIYIICGKGNNGGDGWVAGRYLKERGYDVTFGLVGKTDEISGDAEVNYEKTSNLDVRVEELEEVPDLSDYDLIIDAVLGTGFSGEPRGLLKNIIDYVNSTQKMVVAVDIPSGVDGDNGNVPGNAFICDMTVTFALPKLGQVFWPAKGYTGKLTVVDIGIPDDIIETFDRESDYRLAHESDMLDIFPRRQGDGHKGTFGKGVLVSGSKGLTGAAALASEAFLRSGAGYATLGIPESLSNIMETKLTEVITEPLPEACEDALSFSAFEPIMDLMKDADSAIIGPGLSTHAETIKLVEKLVREVDVPFTLDADALNAISELEEPDIWEEINADFVMTPHFGELSRLLNRPISELKENRLTSCREWASRFGGVMVIKGTPTIVVAEDSPIYLNSTGNDGLATAGSGDVLSGLIGGFLAQGLKPINAAKLGVFIHGLAADSAAEQMNRYNLIASDLLETLPAAFNYFLSIAPKEFFI